MVELPTILLQNYYEDLIHNSVQSMNSFLKIIDYEEEVKKNNVKNNEK